MIEYRRLAQGESMPCLPGNFFALAGGFWFSSAKKPQKNAS